MKIKVNGKEIAFYKKTVMDLIDLYGMKPDKIVVEINGEIVHRDSFNTEHLKEEDIVEIARFVGGG